MKIRNAFIAVSLLASVISCKKTDTTDPGASLPKTILNVQYGNDPLQDMDVYLPANRSQPDTKVIVMIHGGGWNAGDKADFNAYVDTLQRRFPTYAIFNLNYRLAAGIINLFPTQEMDVKSAVEFIYSKRSEYLISDKYAFLGASAGAHLALLQGYKHTSPVKPKAIVDFFGPADMTAMYNNPTLPGGEIPIFQVTGTTPAINSTLYFESSPINYVTADASPTIILHGGADIIVRHEQSDSLAARLDSAGVAFTSITYPSENHGWEGPDLFDSFNRIQDFLDAYVK